MHLSTFLLPLAAGAAAEKLGLFPIPIPSLTLTDGGFSTIGNTLLSTGQNVSISAADLGAVNAKFSANVSLTPFPNVAASMLFASVLNNITTQFWSTATQLERQVCAVASSLNQQQFLTTSAQLVAGVEAELTAVAKLAIVVVTSLRNILSLIVAFSSDEKRIIHNALQALLNSIFASLGPLSSLSSGLKLAGSMLISGALTAGYASLSGLVDTIASFKATVGPA